jgi:hypothetical protein
LPDLLYQLRAACAEVAARALHVRLNAEQVPGYAAQLPLGPADEELDAETRLADASRADLIAFWITLDAINFGSGWFPTLRKRAGRSGYFTVAAGLRERFADRGPWTAPELTEISAATVAHTLGQDPGHELMELFARSLRDLGRRVLEDHGGSFAAPVDTAGGSAGALVEHLSRWDCYTDLSIYDGLELPFLKRAQIAAADLHRAGVAHANDLERLTMFADNLVPHVLRLDGLLEFEPGLVERIERQELIEHGSPEEVEIRACGLHAVELIAAARPDSCPADIDQVLWLRGQEPRYKARPRHRSRCTAY